MVRVLIAEDSPTTRELLRAILGSDKDMQIVGEAHDGQQAVALTEKLRPDVVTMDIRMPRMDGFEATRRIMQATPTPIVIVSGHVDVREVQVSMQALRAGALTVLAKPKGPMAPQFEDEARHFVRTVKMMAGVKVVRRWRDPEPEQVAPPIRRVEPDLSGRAASLVAIGTSTGGPAALQRVLCDLPADFAAPIVVVQHIATGFIEGLASWLAGTCPLAVKVAVDGEVLQRGKVYLAPDDRHLVLESARRLGLSEDPPLSGFRPSASALFETAARYRGGGLAAVVMTGMGDDGVRGLRAVQAAGGVVIAQDEASSIVWGMPGAAVAAGVVDVVLPLAEIGPRLQILASGAAAEEAG